MGSVYLGLPRLSFEGSNVLLGCSCSGSSREPECRGLLSLRPSLCVRSTSHCEEVFSCCLLAGPWWYPAAAHVPSSFQAACLFSLAVEDGVREHPTTMLNLSWQPYPRP